MRVRRLAREGEKARKREGWKAGRPKAGNPEAKILARKLIGHSAWQEGEKEAALVRAAFLLKIFGQDRQDQQDRYLTTRFARDTEISRGGLEIATLRSNGHDNKWDLFFWPSEHSTGPKAWPCEPRFGFQARDRGDFQTGLTWLVVKGRVGKENDGGERA